MLICKAGQESGMKLESRIRYELYDLQVEFLRHLAMGDGNSIRYDAEGLARTHEAFFFFFMLKLTMKEKNGTVGPNS